MDTVHVPRSRRAAIYALGAIFIALCAGACSRDPDAPYFVSSNPFVFGERQLLVGLVVAGDQLYWAVDSWTTDYCQGAVFTAPKSGGSARQLSTGCVWALVSNGADVYWSKGGWWDPTLLQWLAPGAKDPVAIPAPAEVLELAVSGPLVYAELMDSSLVVIPQDGGVPETLVADAGWMTPNSLVADETGLSWFVLTGFSLSAVMHLSPSDTVPRELAALTDPGGLISAAGALWYLDSPLFADAGTLFRIPGVSAPPEPALQTGPMAHGLAGDATGLSWVELGPPGADGGALVRARLDGGVPSTVVRTRMPEHLLQMVAIDDAWLYFAVAGDERDEIWRVRRN